MKKWLETNKVILSGEEVEYTLTRKNIKNINVRIKPDASIAVSAPFLAEQSRIENFMVSKSDFILRNLREMQKVQMNPPRDKAYVDGESFYLLGKSIRLKILEDRKEDVWLDGEFLFLKTSDMDDRERNQRLVEFFFEKQREAVFQEIIDRIYPIFSEYGISYPTIKMRSMKTRWGSCISSKRKITLNKKLIATPKSCIEYVVLHEFSHFIHPNHSKDFYDFVGMLMPDWKERKRCLDEFAYL